MKNWCAMTIALALAGCTDAAQELMTALQNAASVAGLLPTIECVVVEKKEDKRAAPSAPMLPAAAG